MRRLTRMARGTTVVAAAAVLVGAITGAGAAYGEDGSSGGSTIERAADDIHTLTVNGADYTVTVIGDVDLAGPIELGQPDGTTAVARISAIDGIPLDTWLAR